MSAPTYITDEELAEMDRAYAPSEDWRWVHGHAGLQRPLIRQLVANLRAARHEIAFGPCEQGFIDQLICVLDEAGVHDEEWCEGTDDLLSEVRTALICRGCGCCLPVLCRPCAQNPEL